MNDRLKQIRKFYGLTQAAFGQRIGLKPTAIGEMEAGNRNITDRTMLLLEEKYNVNSNWLKSGYGNMFNEIETFSLDEYAQKKQITDDELEIIKCYLELDTDIRKAVISQFKEYFLFNKSSPTASLSVSEKKLL